MLLINRYYGKEGAVLTGCDVVTISPFPPRRSASISLKPAKNLPCRLRVQTHVAVRGYSSHLHVLEQEVAIPRFSRFCSVPESKEIKLPESKVVFAVNESVTRFYDWIAAAFVVPPRGSGGIKINSANDKIKANFVSVCPSAADYKQSESISSTLAAFQSLYIFASQEQGDKFGSQSLSSGFYLKVEICCDSMELAGEIVQDICKFFAIEELESEAQFASEMKEFEDVLARVADLNSDRLRLTADMAEDSQRVKVNFL